MAYRTKSNTKSSTNPPDEDTLIFFMSAAVSVWSPSGDGGIRVVHANMTAKSMEMARAMFFDLMKDNLPPHTVVDFVVNIVTRAQVREIFEMAVLPTGVLQ